MSRRKRDFFEFPEFPELNFKFPDFKFPGFPTKSRGADSCQSFTKVRYTYPVGDEPANDPVEYKVVHTDCLIDEQTSLEEGLNKLGAEGWELKSLNGTRMIFMRFIEGTDDETEESGSEDV